MPPPESSRRRFLQRSAAAVGGGWVVLSLPAALATMDVACANRESGNGFRILTPAQAAELDELTAQIFPSDGTPGAREAGVVWFIDASLDQADSTDQARFRSDLQTFQGDLQAQSGASSLMDLTPEQRIEALTALERSDFFEAVRDATISGMFAHPRHGGNRDKLGWALLGFDDRHVWQPPFGHYDDLYTTRTSGA